jgi:hypothetical protein
MKKKLLFLIILISGFYSALQAQPISGTKSVGPTGDYLNLTAAITAIQVNTLSGATILELQSGYTSAGETFPLNLTNLTTTSSNTLTIRPESAATALSISGAGTSTISFTGANYVTIDGRPGGTGSSKELTIQNTSTTGNALVFINDASNNILQYCIVKGVTTAAATGTILFSTTTGSTGNDNNTIDNCDIIEGATTPAVGIYCNGSGTAGLENSGNTISNCNIANFFSATVATSGILVSAGGTNWTVTNNKLYQSVPRTYTTAAAHRAISILAGNGYTVLGNTIGFTNTAGTGVYTMNGAVATTFAAINLTVGTVSVSSVQGNTIAGISLTSTATTATIAGVFCGINVTAGNVNIGTTTANTIGGATGTGSIALIPGAAGALMGINTSSTGIITIQNNNIGSLSAIAAAAATATAIHCINISAIATSITISGNTIGNGTANNVVAGILGTTTGATLVTGINWASVPTAATISTNTIQNLSSYGSATTAYVRGIQTGITTGTSAFTINDNTITNLATNSTLVGVANGQCAAVGIQFLPGFNSTISGNQISGISCLNTATTNIIAAGIAHGTAANTTITRNRIWNISNAGTSTTATTPAVVAGIVSRSGTSAVNIINNMISLGSGQSTNTAFVGIWGNHASAPDPTDNIYHNTVHITGTATGSMSSFDYLRGDFTATTRTAPVNIKNNIFTNDRTGGTGKHYAIGNNFNAAVSAAGWVSNASDYNVLNALPATVGYWGADMDFPNWKLYSLGDANSFSGITVTYVNTASDLHLNMGLTPTALESGGIVIANLTTDYDGQARPGPAGSVNGGGTAPDLGADEFDGVHTDLQAPVISYTALGNTGSTTNRTLSGVTITDAETGVPVSGSLVPRIWYRRNLPTATAWTSSPGTLTTGTSTSGTWSFTIDYSLLSITPSVGETFEYYVVAQDIAGNLGYNPASGASHTNVNTQIAAPTTPNNYAITATLPTTVSVGTGQTYTSITGAGGLFSAINTGALSGNTIATITSDLSEDGTNALNSAGLSGYTLTIKPDAATVRVISNSAALALAMIRINGVSGLTIDGQFASAGQYLRIVNTHTTAASGQPAIQFLGGSSNNVLRSLIVETNASTLTLGSILFGAGANTGNIVETSDIRDAQGTPGTIGIPANAIYSNNPLNTVTIQNNNIYNFSNGGTLFTSVGNNCSITGNSFYYNAATAAATAQTSILVAGNGNGQLISGNFIGGQAPACGGGAWTNSGATAFSGINTVLGVSTTSNITNNTIKNINRSGTGASTFFGITNTLGKVNISGNTIGDPLVANSIVNAGTGVTNGIEPNNTDLSAITTVSNNTIANISSTNAGTGATIKGINFLPGAVGGTVASAYINNNTIFNLSSLSALTGFGVNAIPALGIMIFPNGFFPVSPMQVNGNTIYNITAANATAVATVAAGIGFTNFTGEGARNRIYNIKNYSTAATTARAVAAGIFSRFAQDGYFHDNMIALGDDIANNVQINGFMIAGVGTVTNTHYYYHNTVYLYNTTNSPSASGAFQRGETNPSGTVFPVTLTDNIFYNAITSAGEHYAIRNYTTVPATNWPANASNYNLLYSVNPLQIGQWGTTGYNLSDWQTIAQQDAASKSKTVSFVSAAAADLHLAGSSIGDMDLAGLYLPSYNLDFDLQARNNPPYMGSDENVLSPLPVVISSFTARASGSNGTINWNTEVENNVAGYEVEASSNGADFNVVGSLNAKGNSNGGNEYEFIHHNAIKLASSSGLVYYRIKVKEFSGKFEYTRTLPVAFNKSAIPSVSVYPNPVRDRFTISVANASGSYSYRITDINGRLISRKTGVLKGSSIWQVNDLQNETPGTYFMDFQVEGVVSQQLKITKQ